MVTTTIMSIIMRIVATTHTTTMADDYMYALAVLTNGGNITAEDSVVDEASTFIHEDEDEVEVGTITIQ